MDSFTLRAPAKLNLMLAVSPQIIDGRHQLTSVFSTINLFDQLTFAIDNTQARLITIEVTSTPDIFPSDLPTEKNIVYKAITVLEKVCGRSLEGHLAVHIEKNIPHEAGLAGGSTDAAATLRAMARIWGIDLLGPEVLKAASELGADVLFFLYGGCALMEGSGDKLRLQFSNPNLDLVLVKPQKGISTAAAYAAFDDDPQPVPSSKALPTLLMERDPSNEPMKQLKKKMIAEQLGNNLTKAACSLLPELSSLIEEMAAEKGVYCAIVTGSGSTVFGVCENPEVAAILATEYRQKGYWATIAKTTSSEHK